MKKDYYYTLDTSQRRFSIDERYRNGLPKDPQRLPDIQPDERGCLIHLNSTYLDMIDSRFLTRGDMWASALLFVTDPVSIWMFCMSLYGIKILILNQVVGGAVILAIMICALVAFTVWANKIMLGHDFFTYTHYPIRFNRKTRMIHVFRHNGPGGVLSVPWDEAWFHIGQGSYHKVQLMDLRGQVMNGDAVVDSFAVGNCASDTEYLKQVWKFISIYMEQGPQALPRDNYIMISADDLGLYNQFIGACAYGKMLRQPLLRLLFTPLITITRWLVMKSCKVPVWPPEIEAESAIEQHDPYVWKEPEFKWSDLFKQDPEVSEKNMARLKRLGNLK